MFASVPFHAFFGVALMSGNTVIGGAFYRALALPWVTDPLADQKLGGGLAWASGEIPLLLVLIALLVQWSRQDERTARRDDRRADADGDADLVAYNAMLRRLATPRAPLVADGDESAPVTRPSPRRRREPADAPPDGAMSSQVRAADESELTGRLQAPDRSAQPAAARATVSDGILTHLRRSARLWGVDLTSCQALA